MPEALAVTAATPLAPKPIKRVFRYAGMTLEDPLPGQPCKVVRTFHGSMHAQIANAKIEGPTYVGDEAHYTYVPQTGTNG